MNEEDTYQSICTGNDWDWTYHHPYPMIPRKQTGPIPMPSVPKTAPAAAPAPPAGMRTCYRISPDEFSTEFLPREIIHTMMHNKVVPLHGSISAKMIKWCDENCSDYWMVGQNNLYFRFAASSDMTLFLTMFKGG